LHAELLLPLLPPEAEAPAAPPPDWPPAAPPLPTAPPEAVLPPEPVATAPPLAVTPPLPTAPPLAVMPPLPVPPPLPVAPPLAETPPLPVTPPLAALPPLPVLTEPPDDEHPSANAKLNTNMDRARLEPARGGASRVIATSSGENVVVEERPGEEQRSSPIRETAHKRTAARTLLRAAAG
jgi:hypothetical protein